MENAKDLLTQEELVTRHFEHCRIEYFYLDADRQENQKDIAASSRTCFAIPKHPVLYKLHKFKYTFWFTGLTHFNYTFQNGNKTQK